VCVLPDNNPESASAPPLFLDAGEDVAAQPAERGSGGISREPLRKAIGDFGRTGDGSLKPPRFAVPLNTA